MKKFLSVLLSLCIILSLAVSVTVTADSYDFFFEGEDYTRTNWRSNGGSPIQSLSECSNGKYLNLYNSFGSLQEFYAEYEIEVSKPGVYALDLAVTVLKKGWSSPVNVSVNGGDVIQLEGKQFAVVSSARGINWYHCGSVNLIEGKNTISFIVNENISSGERAVCFLDCFGLTRKEYALKEIVSPAPLQTFQQGEKLEFTIKGEGLAPEDMPIAYDVLDFEGKYCDSGKTVLKKGKASVDFSLKSKKNGAYQIIANCNGKTVVQQFLVVTNLKDRKKYDDTPFGLDALIYGMSLNLGGKLAKDYADVLELTGITWIRDRVYFDPYVKKEGDKFVFSMPHNNFTSKMMAERGIKVLQDMNSQSTVIHSADDYGVVLPTNLFETYQFWKQLAEYSDGLVTCWEIQNEVDLGGGHSESDGADVYSAVFKAAALGIIDSETEKEVFVAPFGAASHPDHSGQFTKLLFENDIYDFCNMADYHTHRGAPAPYAAYHPFPVRENEEYKNQYSGYRELSDKHGYNVSLWNNETGIALDVPAGTDYDAEEQMVQGRYLVTSFAEELAVGTDKRFYFDGTSYQEGVKSWGMMSRSSSSPSSYAAFGTLSAMTYVLGEGVYLGKLKDVPEGVLAFAFADGDDTAIVYYSTSESGEKYDFAINTGKKSVKYFDIFANEKKLYSQDGNYSVTAEANPQYIKFTGRLSDDAFTDDIIDEYVQIGDTQKSVDDGKRVILLQKYPNSSRAAARKSGYDLFEGTTGVDVEVFNFNDYAVTGTIFGESANGWGIEPASQSISIAPMTSETVHFEVTPDSFRGREDRIKFYGNMSCGRTTDSVVWANGPQILNAQPKISNGEKFMNIKIANSSDTERTIVRTNITVNGISSESTEQIVIEPKSKSNYDVPAQFKDDDKKLVYEAEIEFSDGFTANVSGETAIAVAKRKIDFSGTPNCVLPDDGVLNTQYYYGRDDLYGEFYFAADENNFYFGGKVTDNAHVAPYSGWDLWRNDGIQFSIGKGLPGVGIPYYELGMSLTDSGNAEAYYWMDPDKPGHGPLEGIDCKITRDEGSKTTTYYIAVPWSVLPRLSYDDGAVAFSMLLNETDGHERGYVEWGGGIARVKDPSEFRAVIFDQSR